MDSASVAFCGGVDKSKFVISDDPDLVHILPISGGADSSALAIFLHESNPHIDFKMVMTDTGAEDPDTYEFLDKIEALTGKKIERISAEKTLFEMIEGFSGYLPSGSSRWCTRELKLKPFVKWMAQFKGMDIVTYVGIRADEQSRVAFSIDGVETVMPFVEMGWNRDKVFGYLSRSLGIPSTYKTRTRSGCKICPFTRRQESIGLLQRRPDEFEKFGVRYEKLSSEDIGRHEEAVPLWKDAGESANWVSLPLPKDGDVISGKSASGGDLFGNRGMFVAAEFFMDAMPGMMPFIWHQRLISYSPSMNGMKRQVDDRYQHLLRTGEVYGMTPDEVREKVRFAIYFVELPGDAVDFDGPRGKSYTWQRGQSYAQVRHVVQWLTRALNAEQMRVEANRKVSSELSVAFEWKEMACKGLERAESSSKPLGQVIGSMWYLAKEDEPDLTEDEKLSLIPCPLCHI